MDRCTRFRFPAAGLLLYATVLRYRPLGNMDPVPDGAEPTRDMVYRAGRLFRRRQHASRYSFSEMPLKCS